MKRQAHAVADPKIKTLIGKLGDSEAGFHASLLLSNIELSQYGQFVDALEDSHRLQHQIAFELLRVLHPKILVQLERIERRVFHLSVPELTRQVRDINDQTKRSRNYSSGLSQLKERLRASSVADLKVTDELVSAVEIMLESILATERICRILLQSPIPHLRKQAYETVSRMGKFGGEIIEHYLAELDEFAGLRACGE